jgi:hypothetical protein
MPQPKNKVIFCLDSSGSMNAIAKPTVDAFNKILEETKASSFKSGQDTSVSLYTFGERSSVVRKIYDVPIGMVRPLAHNAYRPDGQTPMFDCVGEAIEDHLTFQDGVTAFVLNCITDGQENHSRRFRANDLKRLVTQVQRTDFWTVTFMVPRGDKAELVRQFDIPDGNVAEWDVQSAEGVAALGRAYSAGMGNYYATRSAGRTSTRGFFVTDMSKVSTSDVRRQLTDVSGRYVALRVPAEATIRDFVENSGFAFGIGRAFYQLSKDEEVQPQKQILLREKGKHTIYGGAEARSLLGLPDSLTVKVRPGNHANWDIFVQSTSVNRRLVRGTTLMYER